MDTDVVTFVVVFVLGAGILGFSIHQTAPEMWTDWSARRSPNEWPAFVKVAELHAKLLVWFFRNEGVITIIAIGAGVVCLLELLRKSFLGGELNEP